ncbi:polyphosphate kinase 1 [Aestuariicella hydrocarbonica]|uniref:Polyphosphate kinase n=1 Tax=Pseudomaricurvus hydrocarbonicus TaxID=1470433 RepID=A0A9E5MPU6_9GAMM|nr:polyphosphate kinase 1 [Aestuariicella hydrocarbonica]NHO68159.1 polyphosphate kinase 1 [Aestuariicella hydrocarbonica]
MDKNTPELNAKSGPKINIVPRELSWLSFNERVMQEAADSNTPIIERMRFLGIFSNNMDEFFRVRVAEVRRRILLPHLPHEPSDDYVDDEPLMQEIQDKVVKLNKQFDKLYQQVSKDLQESNIYILPNHQAMSDDQSTWLKQYFRKSVRSFICPIIVHRDMDLGSRLSDDDFYLAVEMEHGESIEHALIEVPTKETSRFILLPNNSRQQQFILLDDAIKHCLDEIFGAVFVYDSIKAFSFKMTRDAELNLSDDIDQSVLDKMSKGLRRRLQAEPVRLVYDQDMPESLLKMLTKRLKFSSHDSMIPSGPYRNFRDFISFPNVGGVSLEHRKLAPVPCHAFDSNDNALDAIAKEDILLYYPYHSFGYFTELLRQAAFDPRVSRITINIYRVAKNSRVLHALCDAARNGKKVTVVVELQARFDEFNNIELSKQLEAAGIHVDFGIPTLKVHSKLCLIERREGEESKLYAHIGTGNFHEGNAKIYTDFSYFTAHPEITAEVAQVFEFIKYTYRPFTFNHLIVSPLNSRNVIKNLIKKEIREARAGRPASIYIKVNNLCDNDIAELLCQADQSGVEIKMLIRGMCSLQTGDKGISDHMEVHSIVDRFLEHARVFVFGNKGDPKVFITSADLMKRNIDHRVEVGVPIYNTYLKRQIIDIFNLQMSDNTKARILNKKQSNPYVQPTGSKKVRSQIAIHQYLSRIEKENIESDYD